MRVRVDQNKCIGCRICIGICPEGIEVVNGKARIKDESANCLKDAADACPMKAIIFEDEKTENHSSNSQKTNAEVNQHPVGFGRAMGRGFGRGRMGRFGAGPTGICRCPKCGYEEPKVRGIPCVNKKCPKCGTFLVRA